MKNQYNRSKRHNNNRSVRSYQPQQIFRYTNLDSTGPLGKLRGTPLQLAEKYQAGAKDASLQGDDVLVQTCQQYADHYLRLQAIAIENEQALKPKEKPVEEVLAENVDEVVTENTVEQTEHSPDTISESVLPPEVPITE